MGSITRVTTKTNSQLQIIKKLATIGLQYIQSTIKKFLESNYEHITIICKLTEQEPPTQMEMEKPPLLHQSPMIRIVTMPANGNARRARLAQAIESSLSFSASSHSCLNAKQCLEHSLNFLSRVTQLNELDKKTSVA